jgi:hypothetical protein
MPAPRSLCIPNVSQEPLHYVLERDLVPPTGMVLEFGVYTGTSINYIADQLAQRGGGGDVNDINDVNGTNSGSSDSSGNCGNSSSGGNSSSRTVYGFDSFEGLPETWARPDMTFRAGTFDVHGMLPVVRPNVVLVRGWFDATLPPFLAEHSGESVALLHIDCDLYSSTKTVLEALAPRFRPGTVVVFDELINYPNYEAHEWRAWWEIVDRYGLPFEWLAMNGDIQSADAIVDRGAYDQKVALRIL